MLHRCCQKSGKGAWLVTFYLHTGWRKEEQESKEATNTIFFNNVFPP